MSSKFIDSEATESHFPSPIKNVIQLQKNSLIKKAGSPVQQFRSLLGDTHEPS